MAVGIRSQTYHDSMGRSRRQRAWLKRGLVALGIFAVVGALGWVFFFSSVFAISDVQVQGADTLGDTMIRNTVQGIVSQRHLYILQPLRNILLLNTATIAEDLRDQYAAIGQVIVTKHYPHTLEVQVTERQPTGTWCRGNDCQFFDDSGIRWGMALSSSGPLLLLVDDQRAINASTSLLFEGVMTAVRGLSPLGLAAKRVTLPDAEPGGMVIKTTKGYDLMMDALSDVPGQLQVLSIFLADRAKDPSFSPQYIDLRTSGRVYYR